MPTLKAFMTSLAADRPPVGLDASLEALWWVRKGDWERAHVLLQPFEAGAGAWVHGHLHRVEGDLGNATYWYRRAGRPVPGTALDEEWLAIVRELLGDLLEQS